MPILRNLDHMVQTKVLQISEKQELERCTGTTMAISRQSFRYVDTSAGREEKWLYVQTWMRTDCRQYVDLYSYFSYISGVFNKATDTGDSDPHPVAVNDVCLVPGTRCGHKGAGR